MGNICGKSEPDPFSQPGRVLGSAPPPQPKTASVPKTVGGPPRKLGGGGGSTGTGGASQSGDASDARGKAAAAAQARLDAAKDGGGKLSNQLKHQQRQTRTNTLKDSSAQELQRREADRAAEFRTYN